MAVHPKQTAPFTDASAAPIHSEFPNLPQYSFRTCLLQKRPV